MIFRLNVLDKPLKTKNMPACINLTKFQYWYKDHVGGLGLPFCRISCASNIYNTYTLSLWQMLNVQKLGFKGVSIFNFIFTLSCEHLLQRKRVTSVSRESLIRVFS